MACVEAHRRHSGWGWLRVWDSEIARVRSTCYCGDVATAEQQARWRAKRRAELGPVKLGRPASAACGTPSGFNRHKREGTPACAACIEARRVYQREAARRRRSST